MFPESLCWPYRNQLHLYSTAGSAINIPTAMQTIPPPPGCDGWQTASFQDTTLRPRLGFNLMILQALTFPENVLHNLPLLPPLTSRSHDTVFVSASIVFVSRTTLAPAFSAIKSRSSRSISPSPNARCSSYPLHRDHACESAGLHTPDKGNIHIPPRHGCVQYPVSARNRAAAKVPVPSSHVP